MFPLINAGFARYSEKIKSFIIRPMCCNNTVLRSSERLTTYLMCNDMLLLVFIKLADSLVYYII